MHSCFTYGLDVCVYLGKISINIYFRQNDEGYV